MELFQNGQIVSFILEELRHYDLQFVIKFKVYGGSMNGPTQRDISRNSVSGTRTRRIEAKIYVSQ